MADRIVVYKVKIEPHEDNAKSSAKLNKDAQASVRSAEKERAKVQRAGAKESKKLQDGLTKSNQRELAKRGKDLQRKLKSDSKAREKAAKDAARIAGKETKDSEKRAKFLLNLQRKKSKAENREFERASKQRISIARREASRIESGIAVASARIETSRGQMVEGFASGTESVARFARGFAMLGIVGEESQRKLLKHLVTMQATFDIVVGGVNSVVRIRKALVGYAAVVQTTSRLETLRRTKNIALIKAETSAELGLAGARGVSAAAGGAGGGRGVGRAAGGVGVNAAVGFGAARIGAGGGGAAGGVTAASIASLASVFVLATAAAFALVGSIKFLARKVGINNSLTESNTGILRGTLAAFKDARKAEEKTERMIRNAGAVSRSILQRDQDFVGVGQRAASSAAILDIQGRIGREGTPEERIGGLAQARVRAGREEFRLGREEAQFGGEGGDFRRSKERKSELIAIKNLEIQIARDRKAAQSEINQSRIEAAKEDLAIAMQSLGIERQKRSEARGRLSSAAERFGQLDPLQQANLIRIKRKADEQGIDSLTRQERGLIRSVGTEEASDIASIGDKRAAYEAGFSESFGSRERKDIAEADKRIKGGDGKPGLQIQIDDQREIIIEVERQEDALAQRLASDINELLDQRLEIFGRKITDQIHQGMFDATQEFNQRYRDLNATGGRGSG